MTYEQEELLINVCILIEISNVLQTGILDTRATILKSTICSILRSDYLLKFFSFQPGRFSLGF